MNFIFIYVFISGIMITDKIIKKQIQNVFSRQKALWIAVGLACFPGIDMLADVTALSGEVVVVGYGTMEKKQVTSAVTSLSADDMLKGVGGADIGGADITTALQGKISGLLLQNNGSVNGGTTIQLRGMTSIYQGNSGIVFYTDVRV